MTYSDRAFGIFVDAAQRMNPVVRARWADALESGDYYQGQGRLIRWFPDGALHGKKFDYCCLGVLCDLAVQAGIVTLDEASEYYLSPDPRNEGDSCERQSAQLPEVVARWAGLWSSDPRLIVDDSLIFPGRCTLSYLNDVRGLNFTAIARLIREQL